MLRGPRPQWAAPSPRSTQYAVRIRVVLSSLLVISATAPTLQAQTEIIRDRYGINHIYAPTENDLFFAQGYAAARDRLFQFEMWRRQATGTVAEILGAREVKRDIGTRLFKFRGDLERELAHYHPRGGAIIRAFVDGVNAYIAETERDPSLLPIEFRLLGIAPGRWTPEVVISRHQGLLGNIGEELAIGRAVARVGPDVVKRLYWFHPGEPDLALDPAIDGALLSADILGLYDAFRQPVRFRPEDIVPAHRATADAAHLLQDVAETHAGWRERHDVGSNNWVVSGRLTESGRTVMANDPHRALAAPSLRYWVHLVAPGWNVIGGGEPVLPGVSIGHNEHGAWGLTVFETDAEDLYVYRTNPTNLDEYEYRGGWERMRLIPDTIRVKDAAPVIVTHRYTRHGPLVFQDSTRHVAYAVRAGWMEIGGAPYLASLRMNQARTWEEFRAACAYSNIPGENMVWADTAGTIGWQAVGIAPVRPNWSGLVPVPGDGRYEWGGYLPMLEKPHAVNPAAGFIATANNALIPPGYPHRNAVGWEWADDFRWARIAEVLGAGTKLSLEDQMRLQTDYLSIPARTLVPLLAPLRASDRRVERARRLLLDWDYRLADTSVAAGIYVAWVRHLADSVEARAIPAGAREVIRGVQLKRTIDWLLAPDAMFGGDPAAGRDSVVARALAAAVRDLTARLGPEMSGWRYGQPRYKHVLIEHPLSAVVDSATRELLSVGPAPRGGDSYTVNMTGGGNRQTSGASFRIIVEPGNWDAAVGTNTPGQSGVPGHPHYDDLFEPWARDRYFPVAYSRVMVDSIAESRTVLPPR